MRKKRRKQTPVLCDYCGEPAELVTGKVIYPHRPDLGRKKFWRCAPCIAFVGCHGSSSRPLGRLANAELRKAKIKAHAAFDPMWRDGGMSRDKAYAWLARQLEIPVADCHIGMFTVAMCRRVVEVCKAETTNQRAASAGSGE